MSAWTNERLAKLVKLAREGRSGREMAVVLQSSPGQVFRQLKLLGINLPYYKGKGGGRRRRAA